MARIMKNRISDNGIAMLIVLWVLMLLTVIVGEFCFAMRTRVNITRNFKESTEAYYIALAGLNKAVEQTLRLQMRPPNRITDVKENAKDADDGEPEAVDWRFNTELPPLAFGNGECHIRIQNESGKININLADGNLLTLMLGRLDLDDEEKRVIVDSIMDWRDADRNHRLNGAENDYYQSLPEPYDCKDAPFDAREELLRVRGVTPEIYRAVGEAVTIFPKMDAQKKKRRTGKSKSREFDYNRLNINAMPPALWTVFPGMTPELAADIAAFRAEQDFRSLKEVSDIVGLEVYRGMARYLTTRTSPYFIVHSTGRMPGSRIEESVTAVIRFDARSKTRYQMVEWRDTADRRPTAASSEW